MDAAPDVSANTPQKRQEMLYNLVQLSPCIVLSLIVVWVKIASHQWNGFDGLLMLAALGVFSLVIPFGVARSIAYAFPKPSRNYVTGWLYFILLVLVLVSGA